MRMVLKLVWESILRNPTRSILTVVAMIAAASVVSWLVAGYDNMFSQPNADPDKIESRFECLWMATDEQPILDRALVQNVLKDLDLLDAKCFGKPIRANAQKTGATQSPRRGEGRGKRGGVSPDRDSARASTSSSVPLSGAPKEPGSLVSIIASSATQGPGGGRGAPGSGAQPGGVRRMPGMQGELAPVVYGLPTGGGIAVQSTDARQSPYAMKAGMWFPMNSEAAVVSESVASRLDVKVGDSIDIATNAGFFTLKIAGIMEDGPNMQKFQSIQTPFDRVMISSSSGIFVREVTAEKIAGGNSGIESVMIQLKPGVSLEKFQAKYDKKILESKGFLAPYGTVLDAMKKPATSPFGGGRNNMTQAYAATAISMLVSFFIIFTTLSMGVDERIRQFAILRIVAFTRYQVAALIFIESLIFGFMGWLGGLASGYLLLNLLSASDAVSMKIGFWTILLTGACSILGAVSAAILPMWRAMRIRPLDAMNASETREPKKISVLPCVVGLLLLGVNPVVVTVGGINDTTRMWLYVLGCGAMVIGFVCLSPILTLMCEYVLCKPVARLLGLHPLFLLSQLRANLWKTVGTVISLSIGLGFFMMLLIWSSSMLIPYIPGDWMPDYFVSIVPGGLSDETAAQVADLVGVKKGQCAPIAIEQVKLKNDLTRSKERQSVVRQDNVVMCGVGKETLSGDSSLFNFEFITDPTAAMENFHGNACIIPDYFARNAFVSENGITRNLTVGDSFELLTLDEHPRTITYKVVGIFKMSGWHWFSKISGTRRNFTRTAAMIFAPYNSVSLNFNLDRVNYLWMNLEPGTDEVRLKKDIEALARTNIGEVFNVRGMGLSMVGRDVIRPTSKADLNRSLIGRTNMMVDGMLRMPLLILLVVSISVANTAIASVRSRKREIGIMRAVGLSASGLFRLVLAEAIMIACVATLISLAFGIFSGLCSAQMAAHSEFFGGMGWSFAVPWGRIFDGFVFTLALCLIASFIPAIIAALTHPLTLLQSGAND